MERHELEGVDPLRWNIIRTRLDALRRYSAIDAPTHEDAASFADEMEMHVESFQRLHRAWRVSGTAAAIAGSGANRGKRRKLSTSLPSEVHSCVLEAITRLGSRSAFKDIVKETRWICDRRGLKSPADPTIYQILMRAREQGGESSGPAEILIGQVRLKLPVRLDSKIVMPKVMLAVRSPDGVILAASVAADPMSQIDPGQLVGALATSGISGSIPIRATQEAASVAGSACVVPERREEISRRMASMLGRKIGLLGIVYREHCATDATKLPMSKQDEWVSPDDLVLALRLSAISNNRLRAGGNEPIAPLILEADNI